MSAAGAAAQTVGNAEEDICDLLLLGGAGDRDRTGMTSLEGCEPQRADLLRPRSRHVHQSP